MIKYECDMCHKIFDDNTIDIDRYDIPQRWDGVRSVIPTTIHLCTDCAEKIADMMNVVVDK